MGYYTVLVHWEDPPRKVEYKMPHNRNVRNFIVAFYYSFEIGGQADPWAPTFWLLGDAREAIRRNA